MLLIRPLPPIPRAGRRFKSGRRFLLVKAKPVKPPYVPPRFGQRRYVFDDIPTVTQPIAMLCAPARLQWDDVEFRAIRRAVVKHQALARRQGELEGEEETQARLATLLAWSECEAVAHAIFTPEPETIRDVFLRAEALTMHYGDNCLSELLESRYAEERLLGGLLAACWKVGNASNVESFATKEAANV